MCHSVDSFPPPPPHPDGEVALARECRLTSADGTRFMAYEARPAGVARAGVVVLPDIRGLHGFYKRFTRRLAATGLAGIAVDYYGRQLPDDARERPMAEMFPLVAELRPEQVAADARAAVEQLRSPDGPGCDTVFALGFCFGGSQSWMLSAFGDDFAGCIGFYGRPEDCRPFVDRMRAPLLMLAAGADALTSQEDNHRFAAELAAAGVEHELVMYDGAPHAFFDGEFGFAAECADAWTRVLDFVTTHAGAAR
ncbi:MAG: dienelactone hydrolase family protein [Jatrophihabitantaceae bacterium]